MTSFGWVFDFVGNWLFKSFRIQRTTRSGFFGGKNNQRTVVPERSDKKPTTLWAVI